MTNELKLEYRLDISEAVKIKNWGEKVFALACLKKGLTVFHQIPVKESTIDFRIVNPKASSEGTLVEVTVEDNETLGKDKRKKRQKANMESTGLRNTLLSVLNIKRIRDKNK